MRHKDFRLFWIGQCISLIGTWMQNIGQTWLVLQLTHSAFKLGVISALQFAPMFLFSLFAGVFIDRLPKRKILLMTQTIFMILAFILAVLDQTGVIRYWHLVILATVLGITNTIDMPARQSYLIDLVGKEDLMNAIALNSSVFNAARAIGPAVGGIIIGVLGTAVCFYINGISFLAVLTSLFFISTDGHSRISNKKINVITEIKEGLLYIKNTPVVLITISLVSIVSIFATNFNVLVPVFTQDVLHQKAVGFGLLMSALGIGALIGALSLAVVSNRRPKPVILLAVGSGLAFFDILIGLQTWFWASYIFLAFAGWFMVFFYSLANSTVQLNTTNNLRGRVMSVYAFTFAGLTPIGSLLSGALAHWLKSPLTFIIVGLITLLVFLFVFVQRSKWFLPNLK